MNELALFAGAGCGLLGSRLLGWKTICYVEHDNYCVEVIKARIRDGYLDDAPIWDDVRTFDGRPWVRCVDIVTAGFPCQPWSIAGKSAGEMDERNLWPDTLRIIREIRPRWLLLENVPGLLRFDYIRRIFSDLAESGYDAGWRVLSAAEVGAPHLRKRLWIVAYDNSVRGQISQIQDRDYIEIPQKSQTAWIGKIIRTIRGRIWLVPEFEFLRVADGDTDELDRIRAIGNGQVPAVVRAAFDLLTE